MLWFRPQRLLNILNFIVDPDQPLKPFLSPAKGILRIQTKTSAIAICSLYSVISFINFATGRVLQNSKPDTDFMPAYSINGSIFPVFKTSADQSPGWWRRMILTSRFNLFLPQNVELTSASEIVLGILGSIGFFQRQIMGSFCDLYLLMGALTFWVATRSFAKFVEHGGLLTGSHLAGKENIQIEKYISGMLTKAQIMSISTEKLAEKGKQFSGGVTAEKWLRIEKYLRSLHLLGQLINSAFGSNVTLFLIECVVYYATSIDQVFFEGASFENGAWARKLSLTFFFLNACLILIVAADITQQMNTIKEWLSVDENRKQVPADQVHVILNEVDSNLVALKGNSIFPITYALLANVSVFVRQIDS